MAMIEMLGEKLLTKDGEKLTAEVLAGKTHVGLYFSAHWCPPCRGFTPRLSESYTKSLKDKGLEVVFISSDTSEAEFKEYYGDMPWTALPFADRDRKDTLSTKFKVEGIPTFVILDADGSLVTKNGRGAVSNDAEGKDFPWSGEEYQVEELTRQDTLARMEKKKADAFALPISWLITAICCFWLPLCCFLAAANTLPSCEELGALIGEDQSLASFIKEYSLIMVLSGPVVQLAVTLAAYSGNRFCFKWAEMLHMVTGFFQLGLMIRGWMHYTNTTDEACYDGDGDPSLDHYISPRTLLFGILLGQTIMLGLACICVPVCFLAFLKAARSEA